MLSFGRLARWTIVSALLSPLLVVLLMMADGWLRARHDEQIAAAWFERLDLSLPALWPSGTAHRHPETLWPGVDLRLSPLLPPDPFATTLALPDGQAIGKGRP
jgi:hypothetical protein